MPPAEDIVFPTPEREILAISSDCFQQSVTGLPIKLLREDQRLRHELCEQLEDVVLHEVAPRADHLGCLKQPTTRENPQASEQQTLRGGEQLIAPIHRAAQCLLARQGGAAAAR